MPLIFPIFPVVLQDQTEKILIDCGYIGFLPKIETALRQNDHMGALRALKDKYPQIQVVASDQEAGYISGRKKSLRLLQAEQMQAYFPEEQKAAGEQFIRLL